jgi:hypothetical protein
VDQGRSPRGGLPLHIHTNLPGSSRVNLVDLIRSLSNSTPFFWLRSPTEARQNTCMATRPRASSKESGTSPSLLHPQHEQVRTDTNRLSSSSAHPGLCAAFPSPPSTASVNATLGNNERVNFLKASHVKVSQALRLLYVLASCTTAFYAQFPAVAAAPPQTWSQTAHPPFNISPRRQPLPQANLQYDCIVVVLVIAPYMLCWHRSSLPM